MNKIDTIISQLPPLSDDERVELVRELAKPMNWSWGFDQLEKGLDIISQDIADNDAAANMLWKERL